MDSVSDELDELPYLDGRAWALGDRVTCAQLPFPWSAGTHGETGVSLAEHDLDWHRGDFLVAGVEFGTGEAPEPTIVALQAAGVGAVIGRSFADEFFAAAVRGGFPALQVEETPAIKTGDRLRVDIEGHKVVNLSSGDRYVIRNVYGHELDALRAGGLAKIPGRGP